jgi:hypothetical protein
MGIVRRKTERKKENGREKLAYHHHNCTSMKLKLSRHKKKEESTE